MRSIESCSEIRWGKNETKEAYHLKILLCKLGKKLGFEVDIEEG